MRPTLKQPKTFHGTRAEHAHDWSWVNEFSWNPDKANPVPLSPALAEQLGQLVLGLPPGVYSLETTSGGRPMECAFRIGI